MFTALQQQVEKEHKEMAEEALEKAPNVIAWRYISTYSSQQLIKQSKRKDDYALRRLCTLIYALDKKNNLNKLNEKTIRRVFHILADNNIRMSKINKSQISKILYYERKHDYLKGSVWAAKNLIFSRGEFNTSTNIRRSTLEKAELATYLEIDRVKFALKIDNFLEELDLESRAEKVMTNNSYKHLGKKLYWKTAKTFNDHISRGKLETNIVMGVVGHFLDSFEEELIKKKFKINKNIWLR